MTEAAAKAAYYSGQTDKHPHGLSGKRFILPPEDSKGCWDTHPRGLSCSEWGNAAGFE